MLRGKAFVVTLGCNSTLFTVFANTIVKVMDKKASESREKESNRVNYETNGT